MGTSARKTAPGRQMWQYKFPAGCGYSQPGSKRVELASFVMRELEAHDDYEAASQADKWGPPEAKESLALAFRVERRERQRLALVAVNGKAVNVPGERYKALDFWNSRALQALDLAFNEINNMQQVDAETFHEGRLQVDESQIAPQDDEDSDGLSSPG